MENGGSHTVKRKRSIPESLLGQERQESASRDEAVTRATKEPNTKGGLAVRSTARENGKQGRNKERVMGSPTNRRMSAYSDDNDDTQEETTEGTCGAERVSTPRCSG